MSWMRRCIGITLFEVIITLTIIIILSLIAIPSMVSLIKNHRISSTAEDLYYALQYARSEAVKRNTTIYVSFNTGDSWCYGINPSSSCNCTIAGNCTMGATSSLQPNQITLSLNGYSGNDITFEGTHGAANASGSIDLTLYNETSLIKLNIKRFGNIQLCATGISGYLSC